jgi:hypothetical protein
LKGRPDIDLFVLANHGLVVGGEDVPSIHALLSEVQRRLDISPRVGRPADHTTLARLATGSIWQLPDDEEIHVLATDPLCQRIISQGFLYPCQAIFSGSGGLETFRAIHQQGAGHFRESQRPFLFLNGCGVLVNQLASAAAVAMLAGLAQVVRRLGASTPIRYMTDGEVSRLLPEVADRYQRLASAGSAHAGSSCAGLPAALAERATP